MKQLPIFFIFRFIFLLLNQNNEIDISNAIKEGCDYIGIGPVVETPTKKNKKPIGIERIKKLTKDLKIPWFAIGGIKTNNISYLKSNGFKKSCLSFANNEF